MQMSPIANFFTLPDTDFATTPLADNDAVQYNSTTDRWENVTPDQLAATMNHSALLQLNWDVAGHVINTDFVPDGDSARDLGATGNRWKDFFADSATITGNVNADKVFATADTVAPPDNPISIGWDSSNGLAFTEALGTVKRMALTVQGDEHQAWQNVNGTKLCFIFNPTTIDTTLALSTGSITDSTGAIAFGDEFIGIGGAAVTDQLLTITMPDDATSGICVDGDTAPFDYAGLSSSVLPFADFRRTYDGAFGAGGHPASVIGLEGGLTWDADYTGTRTGLSGDIIQGTSLTLIHSGDIDITEHGGPSGKETFVYGVNLLGTMNSNAITIDTLGTNFLTYSLNGGNFIQQFAPTSITMTDGSVRFNIRGGSFTGDSSNTPVPVWTGDVLEINTIGGEFTATGNTVANAATTSYAGKFSATGSTTNIAIQVDAGDTRLLDTFVTGEIEGGASAAKYKLTSIGGFAIKLTNTTGAVTVAGQLVKADTATNDAVILTGADDTECFGVFLDAGVADDAEAWVVVAGIADVAMEDNTAATRGNWVETSDSEAGYANAESSTPAAAPEHFDEIGHCIETVAAGGGGTHILARCVLHFN